MSRVNRYFNFNTVLLLIIVVVLLLFFRRCGGGGRGSIIRTDTIRVTRDTAYILHDTTISYVPKPYKVEKVRDSIIYLELMPTDEYLPLKDYPPIVKRWIEDYNTKKHYDTTMPVQYGTLRIIDSVYRNSLVGRSINLQQSIPEIKETITLREKPRVVVYGGLTIIGSPSTPLYATGVKLGIMAKNGKYYGGSYLLTKGGGVMYQGEILIPIRLRKH